MNRQMTMPDLFRRSGEEWLEEARAEACKLLGRRYAVTIEDVLQACPRPNYLNRNITGGVFQTPDFKPIGFTFSKRPISHKRVIRLWKLKPGVPIPRDRDFEQADTA